jgi:Xaa-Pro aminopeptidase
VIDSLLAHHGTLFTTSPVPDEMERHEHLDARQFQNLHILLAHLRVEQVSALPVLEELRAVKSPAELDLIRAATYISNLAHLQIMRAVEPGMNEFEIHGIVEYTFFRYGAERPGYAPIVGSGPNSTTLHYRQNDRFMEAGDVLLTDVGAAYQGYTADITRTMPVDGRFTPEQRAIYQAVLDAQKAAEARLRPGATWDDLNEATNAVVAERLAELGLIDAPDAMMQCDSPRWGDVCPQFRLWYMHGLGHGVGLAVHDPDISYYGSIQTGGAFTIEPGIYIRRDRLDHIPDTPENRALAERLRPVVARYRDIGVRIEDMYIVTENGFERISAGVPREIDEIEALLATERIGRRDRVPHVIDWYRRMPQR